MQVFSLLTAGLGLAAFALILALVEQVLSQTPSDVLDMHLRATQFRRHAASALTPVHSPHSLRWRSALHPEGSHDCMFTQSPGLGHTPGLSGL